MSLIYPPEFEVFWQSYPRRIAKRDAFKAYSRSIVRDGATHDQIMKAVASYKKWLKADTWRPDPAHPTTWLNRGSWEDELDEVEPEPIKISFSLAPEIVEKLRGAGIKDEVIKRWFDEAKFIENCIMFKSEFLRDYVKGKFDGALIRAFGSMPELSIMPGRNLLAG